MAETLEIARDVIRKLLESQAEKKDITVKSTPLPESFDYPLVIGS